jgi:CRISPR-associated protein Csy2
MSYHYIVLPRLVVSSANASACAWLVNACPIGAAVLFAHALGRHLGLEEAPAGVAYLHHDALHLGDKDQYYQFAPQQRRGASFIDRDDYAGGGTSLSLQPTASVNLELSLIIALDEDEDITTEQVAEFLSRAKFAGGTVSGFGTPKLLAEDAAIDRSLPNGFWVVDRSELLATTDRTPLQSLLDAVSRRASEEGDEQWLSPIVAGYRFLTTPARKEGGRYGYAHAYAEPLVGLAQFHSSTQRRKAQAPTPFWTFNWPDDTTYVLKQTTL